MLLYLLLCRPGGRGDRDAAEQHGQDGPGEGRKRVLEYGVRAPVFHRDIRKKMVFRETCRGIVLLLQKSSNISGNLRRILDGPGEGREHRRGWLRHGRRSIV